MHKEIYRVRADGCGLCIPRSAGARERVYRLTTALAGFQRHYSIHPSSANRSKEEKSQPWGLGPHRCPSLGQPCLAICQTPGTRSNTVRDRRAGLP